MAYSYHWSGTDPKILRIGFSPELTDADIHDLRQEFKPLLEEKQPLLALVDLNDINIADSPMRFLSLLNGVPNDVLNFHARNSRLAILGGGYPVAMLLKMYAFLMEGTDPARVFNTEEEAVQWLRREAQQTAI